MKRKRIPLILSLFLIVTLFSCDSKTAFYPVDLRCEFRSNPLGIEELHPALSWKLYDSRRGASQTAYELQAASTAKKLRKGTADLWQSGKVMSDQSHLVIYEGIPPVSTQRVWWRVRYWDQHGQVSKWSEPVWWEMGILSDADWQAAWISAPPLEPLRGEAVHDWIMQATIPRGADNPLLDPVIGQLANEAFAAHARKGLSDVTPAFMVRKEFHIPDKIARARLYIATLGFHELSINGASVDDHRLEPSVGHYSERAYYVVKDVEHALKKGDNCIGLLLSKGRYNENPSSHGEKYYGKQPATLVRLVIETTRGMTYEISSDESWTSSTSSIIKDSFWVGEVQDARLEQEGWSLAGFDDTHWVPVVTATEGLPRELVALPVPPEREIRRVSPVALTNPAPGVWVYDMGELIVGNAELSVQLPAGTRLSLRYSEDVAGMYPEYYYNEMQNYNNLSARVPWYDDPETGKLPGMLAPKMRGGLLLTGGVIEGTWVKGVYAVPTDLFVTSGKDMDVFQRRFGYRAFRYVELMGYPGEPPLDAVSGIVMHTGLDSVGSFSSANPLLNEIEEATNRTLLYNLHGIQHDNVGTEKGSFPHLASLNYGIHVYRNDFAPMSYKLLEDVRVFTESESLASICFGHRHAGPGISPGATISEMQHYTELPWQHYLYYGDRRELERHYPAIQKYIRYWHQNPDFPGRIRNDMWSDHMAYTSGYDIDHLWKIKFAVIKPECKHPVPTDFYGTTVGYQYVGTAADIARLLNKPGDEAIYRNIQAEIADAVTKNFYDQANKIYCPESVSSQGSNALAVYCGLAPQQDIPYLVKNIISDMNEKWNGHISTGSRTSFPLLSVLSNHDHIDTAYDIMASTAYPSLGHMLSFGTGTIGESWGVPDAPPVTNHCQAEGFSQMTHWFYAYLCGLKPDPDQPGFKHFFVTPKIPEKLSAASMRFDSNYGDIAVGWENNEKELVLTLTVPPNSSATVTIPTAHPELVREGNDLLEHANGVRLIGNEANGVKVNVVAGHYVFISPR